MKKLFFISTLFFSFGCFAQITCPQTDYLRSATLSFFELSDLREENGNKGPLFGAEGYFEADDKVWILSMGIFDENNPRLQAKQLLKKAKPASVVEDDEHEEYCVYHRNTDKELVEFINVQPAPDVKPCPSLQVIKDTQFTHVLEYCNGNTGACGQYITSADIEDRGTNWILLSGIYDNEAMAISETEELKKKAHKPEYNEQGTCLYFNGITKQGVRIIMAINKKETEKDQSSIKKIMHNKIQSLRFLVNHP